jgi:hypothetical protein
MAWQGAQPLPPCGNPECSASYGVQGNDTSPYLRDGPALRFGSGRLDGYGFWEFPCEVCATVYERDPKDETRWPFLAPPQPRKWNGGTP